MPNLQSSTLSLALSPRSIIRALWKWKLTVLVCWVAATAGVIAIVQQLRPIYEAQSLILVESQKIPENFVASTVQTALEPRLDRLKQRVLSRERLWALIGEFDLYGKQRATKSQEEVIEMMRTDVQIRLERGWSASRPGAIRVSYQTFDAGVAAAIANRIGGFFINENLRERAGEAEGTSKFLDGQLAASKAKLQEQEAKLSAFKIANNGELPQQETALLAAMAQSKADLLGTQEALGRAQQNRIILDSALSVSEANLKSLEELARRRNRSSAVQRPVVTKAPAPTELELAEAQLRSARLRYADEHPEVQRRLREVADLRRQAKADANSTAGQSVISADPSPQTTEPSPGAEEEQTLAAERERTRNLRLQLGLAQQEIANLDRRRQRVLEEVADVQRRIANLPIREQQLASVTRDYETSKANYRSLLDKKLAADISTEMEKWEKAEKFVMLDSARVPEKPVRPRRRMLIIAGSMSALFLASFVTFGIELKRNVFLGEWELPLGTVMIGCIPPIDIEGS